MDITITRHDRDMLPTPDAGDATDIDKKRKRHPDADWYPDSVNRKYLIVDTQLFRDSAGKDLALKDFGDRLEATRPSTRETIADMVAIAAHRGWHRIAVGGDRDGRREAWLAARLHGLEVTGYEPSKVDLAALEKAGGVGARAQGAPALATAVERANAPPAAAPSPLKATGAPEKQPEPVTRAAAPVVSLRARDDGPAAPSRAALPAAPSMASSFAPAAGGIPQPPAAESSRSWQPGPALAALLAGPPSREAAAQRDPVKALRDALAPTPQIAPGAEPTREGERRAQLFAMAESSMVHREKAITDPVVRAAVAHMVVIEQVVKNSVRDPQARQRVIGTAWHRMGDFLVKGGVPREPKIEAVTREASHAPTAPAPKPQEPTREAMRERRHERSR